MEIFLLVLALTLLVFASVSDLKKREVPNWLNFSLIIFALAYRAFYSIYFSDLMFFVYGLLGLALFVALAYGFYYARIFAGGDAKLLMGFGAVLAVASGFYANLFIFSFFILLLLFVGGIWGLICSFYFVLMNRKKFAREFFLQFCKNRRLVFTFCFFAFAVFLIGIFFIFDFALLILTAIFLLFPMLFIYGKSVEESCMIKFVSGKELTVGDWLYQEVRVGKKVIKPYWEGLDEKEVRLLRKKKKVKIKQGIPFTPAFLISFVVFILFKNNFLSLINAI